MTAPTKSRSFIVQVDNLQDLFEKFDARMGHTQWERYLTQVPGWETARDHEGRTLLMIAFGSTKGRNPDFYLRSAVADALVARDNSGRNLWHYAYMNKSTLGGAEGGTWERVLKQVPFQVNPVSHRGLFTDLLLNPLTFYTRHTNEKRRNATQVFPQFEMDLPGAPHKRASGTHRLFQWAGPGAAKWWACPPKQEQELFNALVFRMPWQNWRHGNRLLEQLFAQTLDRGESLEDIPAPFHAFATLAQVMTAPADESKDALAAIRDGQLEPFIAHQRDRFFKHLSKGAEDILKSSLNRSVKRTDVREVVSQIRQAHLEQRLAQVEELPSRKARL